MQKTTLLILLAFSSLCLNAQTKLDSLYGVWQDETQSNSNRAEAFGEYIDFGFIESKPDSALLLIPKLIEFGNNNDYPSAMAIGYTLMGHHHYEETNYVLAQEFYEKSNEILEEISDDKNIPINIERIAYIYSDLGNLPEALKYFKKLLKIYEKAEDKIGMATTTNNIGITYSYMFNEVLALDYYVISLKISEKLEDKSYYEMCLYNIAMSYMEQENYPRALEYLEQSLKILEESDDGFGLAYSLNSIGEIYGYLGDFPRAVELIERAMGISEEIESKDAMAMSLSNLGKIYSEKNELSLSIKYFKKALKIYEEVEDRDMTTSNAEQGVAANEFEIGDIYKRQGNFKQSIEHCKKSLSVAHEIGALQVQKDACQCLYEVYKAMNNGNRALVYLEKIQVLTDTLSSEDISQKLQQMEFTKQVLTDSITTAENERLVNVAHQEEVRKKDQTRNYLAGTGLLLIILVGGVYSRLRYTRKSKAIIEKEKNRSESLLLNILPKEVAEELKNTGKATTKKYDNVSILFTDFIGFTELVASIPATKLVEELNHIFGRFDDIMDEFQIEKIETIGDAYMAACGLPKENVNHAQRCVQAAQKMVDFLNERNLTNDIQWNMRVGIHSGPVVAGVVGKKKFAYDLFGDSVNTASRMESNGEQEKINISQSTYELLKDEPSLFFKSRGQILAKGKGQMKMYFVETKLK